MWDLQSILFFLFLTIAGLFMFKVIYNWSINNVVLMFIVSVLMVIILEISKYNTFLGNFVERLSHLLGE